MAFRFAVVAALAAVCLGICGSAGGQAPDVDPAHVELAAINRSILEIVEILRVHLTQRDQDLELRRIEVAIAALDLRSRGILLLEDRMHRLQDERDNAEQRRSRLQQQIAEFEERLRTTDQNTDGQTHLNLSRALDRITAESELIESTLWDLDRQILDFQNQIGQERDSLQHLEEMVDEALETL